LSIGRRVHERHEIELDAVVTHEGGQIACKTRNLSLGGVFLLTDSPLPYGTKIRVRFHLAPLREAVDVEGTIRWTAGEGMGAQFGSLRAREVWGLNQLFKDPSAEA
jgi:hypothetical protein